MPNQLTHRWRGRYVRAGVQVAITLLLIYGAGMGPSQRAAAHPTASKPTSMVPGVGLPKFYDGTETQTRDTTVHPGDPQGTYRIDTHFSDCEQFKADPAPSVRLSMSDADLVAAGLMPRTAFGNAADWEQAVTSAKTRICDYSTLYWTATGAPAEVNGNPSSSARKVNSPPTGDCYCTNENFDTLYSGWAADGMADSHVAQYAKTWVVGLPGPPEFYSAASVWVGGSGLFSHNEVLQQTGIWETYTGFNPSESLFWECVDHADGDPAPCNGANTWWFAVPGDLIIMYTSGNYHWEEDVNTGMLSVGNYGTMPLLDSSEWIVERPIYLSHQPALANFGHYGIVDMQWLGSAGYWFAATEDTDFIEYNLMNVVGTSGYHLAQSSDPPWWDGTYWQTAMDTYWYFGS